MNEQAALIWMTGINNLFNEVEYDGLWLDMNEATGFCDGECVNGTVPQQPSEKQNIRRSLKEKILKNAQDFID
jgi:alpha-glucosidase (family GH31 glycosyl hydrolase)